MYFKRGKVIIISAPSGSGKTTITKFLLAQDLNLHFSVSATSRRKREHERNGVDYYFLDINRFKKGIQDEDFLEWEEVYQNTFYGTLKNEVQSMIQSGKNIIFDIDVKGAITLKNFFKKNAFSIYIDVPFKTIEKRLRNRGTEKEQEILKRIQKIKKEQVYKNKFDAIMINLDLDKLKKDILIEVKDYLKNK